MPMIFRELPETTFVRIRLAQAGAEHLEQARVALDTLRTFVWRTHNSVRQIDVLALEALLHHALGEPQAALAALEQALALAAPAEIVRPFVDLGEPMATLLREAAQDGAQADFATTVLAAFPDGGDPGVARNSLAQPVQQATVEPLLARHEFGGSKSSGSGRELSNRRQAWHRNRDRAGVCEYIRFCKVWLAGLSRGQYRAL
jgi:hypothetical protein